MGASIDLTGHHFVASLRPDWQQLLADQARPFTRAAGEYLAREGELATDFFLITSGTVAIEIRHPLRGPLTVQTAGAGEVVGWSWMLPPYRWQFDARAVTDVAGAALDAAWLREQLETDHHLGYHLCKELLGVLSSRLAATRVRVLDLYR
jgi:CRP/FNR family cyclic AMP-dependent transcriptional regulator